MWPYKKKENPSHQHHHQVALTPAHIQRDTREKGTHDTRAVVALASLHTIPAQMPHTTARVASPLLSTTEPSTSAVPTTESSAGTTEPSGSLGARTGDVADLAAAVALSAGGSTTSGGTETTSTAAVAAGGSTSVFGAVAGLGMQRKDEERTEVRGGRRRRREGGWTYDVTLLATLVARLCLLLHRAVTGDVALKTT